MQEGKGMKEMKIVGYPRAPLCSRTQLVLDCSRWFSGCTARLHILPLPVSDASAPSLLVFIALLSSLSLSPPANHRHRQRQHFRAFSHVFFTFCRQEGIAASSSLQRFAEGWHILPATRSTPCWHPVSPSAPADTQPTVQAIHPTLIS
jgi:hypothetical protein